MDPVASTSLSKRDPRPVDEHHLAGSPIDLEHPRTEPQVDAALREPRRPSAG